MQLGDNTSGKWEEHQHERNPAMESHKSEPQHSMGKNEYSTDCLLWSYGCFQKPAFTDNNIYSYTDAI